MYLPLKTRFSTKSDPVEAASGLKAEFGFDELYVADLDAIMGGEIDLKTISRICRIERLNVMVDAGVRYTSDVERLLDIGVDVVIVATDTLDSLEELDRIVDTVGERHISASIDVVDEKVLSRCIRISELKPSEAAQLLEGRGVKGLILLDLPRVGSESGFDSKLVEGVIKSVEVPILVGGGISGLRDLLSLKEAGVAGVLLATALPRGRLSRREIDAVRLGW